jgi:hypothetical protein
MPHRKITNWTMIREMCQRRFSGQTAEEVEVRAVELAWQHVEEEVATFEREGEVAEVAVMEDATARGGARRQAPCYGGYRMDVDRRGAGRRADTQHHFERRRSLRRDGGNRWHRPR